MTNDNTATPLMETIDLGTNKIGWLREDPEGYLRLHLEHGELPAKYTGLYTTIEKAREDMQKYIGERKQAEEALRTSKRLKNDQDLKIKSDQLKRM